MLPIEKIDSYLDKNIDIMFWLVLIVFGLVAIYYCMKWVINRNKNIQNKDTIDDIVVEAMASKIAFDAEKHRKNQEKYYYIKSDNGKV